MADLTPFEEDTPIASAAARAGLMVYRRPVVKVTNMALVPASLRKQSLDYPKIRMLLMDGVTVPGVELTTDVEYILRRPDESSGE